MLNYFNNSISPDSLAGKPFRLRTSSFHLTGLPGKGETARNGNTFRRSGARERSGETIERILAGRGDPWRSKEGEMAEIIRRVDYYYVQVPDKPGEGSKILGALKEAGINLLAFSGFPQGKRAQLDFVPEDPVAFLNVAKRAKWKLSQKKTGFLVQGDDRVGACADFVGKLAAAKINVTAIDAVSAGAGRYGAIFWVKPRDVSRAAKALGI